VRIDWGARIDPGGPNRDLRRSYENRTSNRDLRRSYENRTPCRSDASRDSHLRAPATTPLWERRKSR